jgi:hypothetical protein
MPRSHYFYSKLTVPELERVIEAYQREFDTMLEDTFSDKELESFESKIDAIAAVYVQPILSELSFDDFYEDPDEAEEQKAFFLAAQSSLCLENLPYFESNPFQVSYLKQLLASLGELLIDRGGVEPLIFKERYLLSLSKFKDLDTLIPKIHVLPEVKTTLPVDPIDFLIMDVYQEMNRLKASGKTSLLNISDLSEKVQSIYHALGTERLDATSLLRKTKLNPKDFDDGLERLKFWLRKH